MEQALLEFAASQGIWVLLFVSLFLYTIKNNEKLVEKQEKREENYRLLLETLTERYAILDELSKSVSELREEIEKYISR